MVPLGFIEFVEWSYLRRDLSVENLRFVELLDVSLGNLLLFVIGEEDGRAILRTNIVSRFLIQPTRSSCSSVSSKLIWKISGPNIRS
jgi:hypothetical protein